MKVLFKDLIINYRDSEVRCQGYSIPFQKLNKFIRERYPQFMEGMQISKRFNSKTGVIERKYAWNAVWGNINDAIGLNSVMRKMLALEGLI